MGYVLVYILKSGFCMAIFYLFYRLLLCRETFFRFNRIMLLGLVCLSLALPFVELTVKEPILIQQQAVDLESLLLMANVVEEGEAVFNPYVIVFLIYFAGLIYFFVQMLTSIGRIRRIIKEGRLVKVDGINIWLTSKDIAPFSWMKNVLISEKDWEENGQEILTHEKAHIEAGHAYDLMFMNICALFQWFNPAVWLLKQELQSLHEYQADETVLKQGIDAKRYQLLLIKKAVGTQRFTSVANSFNQSNLKSRITMMLKGKSNPWRKLKYIGILPLAAVAVATFARPEVSGELEKLSAVKITEIIPEVKIPEVQPMAIADTVVVEKKTETFAKTFPEETVFVVDEKQVDKETVNGIDPVDISRVEVLKTPTPDIMKKYGTSNPNAGIVLITTKRDELSLSKDQETFIKKIHGPLILVDGEVYEGDISSIDPHDINFVSVVKKEESIMQIIDINDEKLKAKAKNGVVLIELKK